jgi:tripartite-type tricarboxylate transporter receptor subunit TctC
MLKRRLGRFAALTSIFTSLLAFAPPSMAETYPTRPITVVSPWTAGGPADTMARPIVQKLSEMIGQPVVLENRAGANGVIGSNHVARAKPDGYTLLYSHVGPITISPALRNDMPYDSVRDFEPITQIVSSPTVLTVRPGLPIHNLKDLVDYARAHPGTLSYGSAGTGSNTHLAGEILARMSGVALLHVPYKGGAPLITDLLGGQIDMAFLNVSSAMPYFQSGQMRGVGVSTLQRSSLLPDLPTIAETYPGFEVNSWYGLMAPANTPRPIVDQLQKNIAAILKMPDIVELMQTNGLAPEGTTPQVFAQQIEADLARWKEVVKDAGLPPQ